MEPWISCQCARSQWCLYVRAYSCHDGYALVPTLIAISADCNEQDPNGICTSEVMKVADRADLNDNMPYFFYA